MARIAAHGIASGLSGPEAEETTLRSSSPAAIPVRSNHNLAEPTCSPDAPQQAVFGMVTSSASTDTKDSHRERRTWSFLGNAPLPRRMQHLEIRKLATRFQLVVQPVLHI